VACRTVREYQIFTVTRRSHARAAAVESAAAVPSDGGPPAPFNWRAGAVERVPGMLDCAIGAAIARPIALSSTLVQLSALAQYVQESWFSFA
jgi:hypothetical protein